MAPVYSTSTSIQTKTEQWICREVFAHHRVSLFLYFGTCSFGLCNDNSLQNDSSAHISELPSSREKSCRKSLFATETFIQLHHRDNRLSRAGIFVVFIFDSCVGVLMGSGE